MLRQAIAIEHMKLFRRKLLWIELALVIVAFALWAVEAYMVSQHNAEAAQMLRDFMLWPNGLYSGVSVVGSVSITGTLVMILVAAFTGQEYGWRTLSLLVSHGLERRALLIAKCAAVLTALGLFMVTALLAGGIASVVLTSLVYGSGGAGQVDLGRVIMLAVVSAYGLLPYAGLMLAVAVLTRSALAPVAIGLAFALLIEGLGATAMNTIGGSARNLSRFFPGDAAQSLVQAIHVPGSPQPMESNLLDPFAAAVVIALYVVAFLAAVLWAFRRQDLNG